MSVHAAPQLAPLNAAYVAGWAASKSTSDTSSSRFGRRQSVCPAKLAAFRSAASVQAVRKALHEPSPPAHSAQPVASPSAFAAHTAADAAVGWQYLLVRIEQVPAHG